MTTAAAMAGLTEPGSWPLPPQLSSYPRNDPKPGREASSSAPPACPDPCQARERSSCICAAGLSLEGYLECCRGVIVPLGSTEQHGPTGRHRPPSARCPQHRLQISTESDSNLSRYSIISWAIDWCPSLPKPDQSRAPTWTLSIAQI
jgi:hypothetical protein